MAFGIKLLVPPAVEPVTLDEFKAHARVMHTDEDSYIEGILIPSAREWCEKSTGRAFIEQTFKLTLDCFPEWEIDIPRPNLISVSDFTYREISTGDFVDLDPDDYYVETDSTPGFIEPSASALIWPTSVYDGLGTVKVTYKAGYGEEATDVPNAIRQAILLVAADWYLNRENMAAGSVGSPTAMTVDRLLAPYWTGLMY